MLRVRLGKVLAGLLALLAGSSSIAAHAQEVARAGLGEATFGRVGYGGFVAHPGNVLLAFGLQ
jgi:hypothetical protein